MNLNAVSVDKPKQPRGTVGIAARFGETGILDRDMAGTVGVG